MASSSSSARSSPRPANHLWMFVREIVFSFRSPLTSSRPVRLQSHSHSPSFCTLPTPPHISFSFALPTSLTPSPSPAPLTPSFPPSFVAARLPASAVAPALASATARHPTSAAASAASGAPPPPTSGASAASGAPPPPASAASVASGAVPPPASAAAPPTSVAPIPSEIILEQGGRGELPVPQPPAPALAPTPATALAPTPALARLISALWRVDQVILHCFGEVFFTQFLLVTCWCISSLFQLLLSILLGQGLTIYGHNHWENDVTLVTATNIATFALQALLIITIQLSIGLGLERKS